MVSQRVCKPPPASSSYLPLLFLLPITLAAPSPPYYLLSPQSFAPLLGSDFAWATADGGGSLPLFDSSDPSLTAAFYLRARVLRAHIAPTGVSSMPYVFTEFAPLVPWAGRANAIPCAAGHHLAEARWLRGPGSAVADSYSAWWASNLEGIKSNYYSFYAFALRRRLAVAGRAASLPLLASLLPNASALALSFMDGVLPGGGNSAAGGPNGCVWNVPGNEGQENSASGTGCRPLVQALLFGEADALSGLCELLGNATCATAFAQRAAAFRAALMAQWNPAISSFDTLRLPRPAPPPSPPPPGYTPFATGTFCCDQAPCVGGHTRFLFEGSLALAACAAKCSSWQGGACHFFTYSAPNAWCQAAQFCNATNPFAGDPSAATYARSSAAPPPLPFAGVRELASLSSPWLYGAVPRENASLYSSSWDTAFDPQGLGGPFGLRTLEARAAEYSCELGSCCWWRGPVWPFETAKALTAAVGILQDPLLAPSVPALTRQRFWGLLRQYTAMHNASGAGGGAGGGAWWISDGANKRANYTAIEKAGLFFPGLEGGWVAEAGCSEDGQWTDNWREGYKYLHSSYLDIIATGVAGLMPQAGSSSPPQLLVQPLQPTDGELMYWALDGVIVGGRTVTVLWDATGARYGRGVGLAVLLDGVLAAHADTTQLAEPLVIPL